METLYLIVGLGNPGREYGRTRHNAGFRLVELLAKRWQACWTLKKKFCAKMAQGEHAGKRVLLCQPQTFMNASGEAVRLVCDYYRVALPDLLVVVDDADLPLGEIRMRRQGGGGGHHGLVSIEQHLGGQDYARLRMGIGRQPGAERQITGHVLGQFSEAENELLQKVLDRAARQVECWLAAGIEQAMNQFNGAITNPDEKKEIE
jgi:PTH1 family peptidyl-tRNA hydrolase